MSFHSLIADVFLSMSDIPLPGCIIAYLSIHILKGILVHVLGIMNKASIKIDGNVLVWTCQLLWVNTKKPYRWIV